MSEVNITKYQEFVDQTLQPRLQELMNDREKFLLERQEYVIAAKKLEELIICGNDSLLSENEKVHTLVDIGCGVNVRAISRTPIKSLKVHVKGEEGEFVEMSASKAQDLTASRAQLLAKYLEKTDEDISTVVTDIEDCLAAISQLKTL